MSKPVTIHPLAGPVLTNPVPRYGRTIPVNAWQAGQLAETRLEKMRVAREIAIATGRIVKAF